MIHVLKTGLFSLAVSALAGCTWWQAHVGPSQAEPDRAVTGTAETAVKPVRFAGEVATPEERAVCEAAGGSVERAGMLGWETCIIPYADAGTACRDSSECAGLCLASDMGEMGQAGAGQCQANNSPFGCYAEMVDGKVGPGLCVD